MLLNFGTQDVVLTAARMFPGNREAKYLTLDDRGTGGTNQSLSVFITEWTNENGALSWTNGPKVLVSIDPDTTQNLVASEANSYVYQAWSETINPSSHVVNFVAVGSRGVDFKVTSGPELVAPGGDIFGGANLPLMEARSGGFGWSSSTGEVTIGTGTTRIGDGYITSSGGFIIDPNATGAPTVPTHGLQINGSLNVQAGTAEDDKDIIFQLNNGNDAKFAVQDLNGQSIFEVNDGPGIIIGNTSRIITTRLYRRMVILQLEIENVSRNFTVTGTTTLATSSTTGSYCISPSNWS